MRQYFDMNGALIEQWDIIKNIESGDEQEVLANSDETDLGLNATNPNCDFVSHRLIYPLHQFDLEHEWAITKKKGE